MPLSNYKNNIFLFILLSLLLIGGCRKEAGVPPPQIAQVMPAGSYGPGADFYLLNEGNMGSNHSSLDVFNHLQGSYSLNIYESINPTATLGLGDVGNDIKIYGDKVYIVVNGSNKVEVLDKSTAVKLCQISIENGRSLAFWKGKVFISSYKGFVGSVDTANLQLGAGVVGLDNKIAVGREPEGLAVAGDKLYVANSGGYSPPIFDNRVSVIDLPSEKVITQIVLDVNLNAVSADTYGHIIVSARGNYLDIPPSFFILDALSGKMLKQVMAPVGNFSIKDSLMYYFSASYSFQGKPGEIKYGIFNLKTLNSMEGSFISTATAKAIKQPFIIAADPMSDKILISDAGDQMSPGTLYWLDQKGDILWKVQTGEIPGHIAFYR